MLSSGSRPLSALLVVSMIVRYAVAPACGGRTEPATSGQGPSAVLADSIPAHTRARSAKRARSAPYGGLAEVGGFIANRFAAVQSRFFPAAPRTRRGASSGLAWRCEGMARRGRSEPEPSGRDRSLRKGRQNRGSPRVYAEDRADPIGSVLGTNGIVTDRNCLVCGSELESQGATCFIPDETEVLERCRGRSVARRGARAERRRPRFPARVLRRLGPTWEVFRRPPRAHLRRIPRVVAEGAPTSEGNGRKFDSCK